MALGWDLTLGSGETGTVDFLLSTTAPSGFYLKQYDPDSGEAVYFSSSLVIISTPTGVPDSGPGLAIPGIAVAGLLVGSRFRFGRG